MKRFTAGATLILILALAWAGFALADTAPASWAELVQVLSNASAESLTITLDRDLTATASDSMLGIGGNCNVTINLNGHTLSRGTEGFGGSVNTTISVLQGSTCTLNGPGTVTDEFAEGVNAYTLIQNNGTLIIDNGAEIRSNSEGVKNNGTLTLEDGSFIPGGKDAVSLNGNSALFTMNGGSISGNTVNWVDMGMVMISGGRFVMNGGSISNNTCTAATICDNSGGSATIEINGGEIIGNTCSSRGEGAIRSEGNFTMTGGTISGNRGEIAGGVFLTSSTGTFKMTGGRITGNTGITGSYTSAGGVVCWGSVQLGGDIQITGNHWEGKEGDYDLIASVSYLPMTITQALDEDARAGFSVGGSVYTGKEVTRGLTAYGTPDNLYINAMPEDAMIFLHESRGEYMTAPIANVSFDPGMGTGAMEATQFPKGIAMPVPRCVYTEPAEPAGTVFEGWEYNETLYEPGSSITIGNTNATLTARWISPWGMAKKALEDRNTESYTLTQDLVAATWDKPIHIKKDLYTAKSIDLQGHTIDASALPTASSFIFRVWAGTSFTINDSIGGGRLTGATATSYYPIEVEGTLILRGGDITGNRSGGIKCGSSSSAGVVRIEGGSITGNGLEGDSTSSDSYGTGVNVQKGTVYMESGTISGNSTMGVSFGSYTTFYMSGGSITGQRGTGVLGSGTLEMSGGSITGNGRGVAISGTINLSGMVTISGNGISGNAGQDLNLNHGKTIGFSGPLDADARIGIKPYAYEYWPYIFTTNLTVDGQLCAVPENFFCPDSKMIGRITDTSGRPQLVITNGVNVVYSANGGSGGNHPAEKHAEGIAWSLPECTFTAPEGMAFDGWQVNGTRYAAGDQVAVTAATTVQAMWSGDEPPTPEEISWTELQGLINGEGSEINITLHSNVVSGAEDQALTFPAGKKVTIDLNGYAIDRDKQNERWFQTILIKSGAEVVIRDGSNAKKGKITGENSPSRGYYACIVNHGTLTLESGRIEENNYGAVDNDGVFIMTGGVITKNGHTKPTGGAQTLEVAVVNRAGGVFRMTGGEIRQNTAAGVWNMGTFVLSGGEITDNDFSGVDLLYGGTLEMSGGKISRNGYATQTGGGMSVNRDCSAMMTGGEITWNNGDSAIWIEEGGCFTMNGGVVQSNQAVGIRAAPGSRFCLGGDILLRSNGNGSTCDVWLGTGTVIHITGQLTMEGLIRIRAADGPNDDNPVVKVTEGFLDENGQDQGGWAILRNEDLMMNFVRKDGEFAFTRLPSYAMDREDFVLPEGIRTIGTEAFANTKPTVVLIPEKEEEVTIEAGAFADCTSLRQIYIPANVTSIGEGAFDPRAQITIFGQDGTAAYTYAMTHSNCSFVYKGQ